MANEITEVFNLLAEEVVPEIAALTFPFTMIVQRQSAISDGKGGQKVTSITDADNWDIPCVYEPKNRGVKDVKSDRWVSVTGYEVKFPCIVESVRVDVTEKDRIEIAETDTAPAKHLQIESLKDYSGIYYIAFCQEVK